MNRWQVLRVLIKEVGFYRKKLLFFSLILVVALGLYFVWRGSRKGEVEASIDLPQTEASYLNQVEAEIEVTKDGQVFIDGKKNNQALKFLPDYDELSISVFNGPGYFISSFKGWIHLPSTDNVRQLIYATHGVGSTEYFVIDKQTIFYQATDISPSAILRLVAYLPKGMVQPTLIQRLKLTFEEFPIKIWLYVVFILPLAAIGIMVFMIVKRRSGRVFFVRSTLTKPPSKDPPAVVGVLVDGQVGAREIAATLIDLARRKYIFIIKKGRGNFSFGKRKSGDFEGMKELASYEKALLGKIFLGSSFRSTLDEVELRIGRHIFSRRIAQFYLDIYNQATRDGYFVKNPAKIHLAYKYLGITLFFASFLGFLAGALTGADPKFGLLFWVGGMAAAAMIIKLSPFMPARSNIGNQILEEWLAFRHYLVSQDNLSCQDVLQGKFEEYLPFAIALGAEVEWARRFADEPFSKPDWYDTDESTVTLNSFVGQFFPLIGYVAENLARSHEPTVE